MREPLWKLDGYDSFEAWKAAYYEFPYRTKEEYDEAMREHREWEAKCREREQEMLRLREENSKPMNRSQAIALKHWMINEQHYDNAIHLLKIIRLEDRYYAVYDADVEETFRHRQDFLDYEASQVEYDW